MAEIPIGYFPDVLIRWSPEPEYATAHNTEIIRAIGGGSQRRPTFPAAGYRRFVGSTTNLDARARFSVESFLNARRGMAQAHYFWVPLPRIVEDVASGSLTAQSRVIIPWRATNPAGVVLGSIGDVRVAGATKSFTARHLVPRSPRFSSLHFDATGGRVDLGNSSLLRATTNYTITAWVYVTPNGTSGPVFSNLTLAASGTMFFLYGSRFMGLFTATAGSSFVVNSSAVVPFGTWAHVAVVKSGTAVSFYINAVGAGTGTITTPVTATANAWLGADISGNYFDGSLNSVCYYDVALSAGEIANIYNENPTPSANRRGWWRLDEGTGTTATDLSGSALNGTLQAGPGTLPVWVSGDTELIFSSPQTGALTLWGYLRERMVAFSLRDEVKTGFYRSADNQAYAPIVVEETY
jgi:Concanavalin A-like lectin/glucanases superfamily